MWKFNLMRLFVCLGVAVLGSACASSRVHTVDVGLYKSLPPEVRNQGFSELEGRLRVVDGKIAKTKASIQQLDQELLFTKKEVELKHTELSYTKAKLREMRRQKLGETELRKGKEAIKLARHQWNLAKYMDDYKRQGRKTLEQEIAVLDRERDVVFSEIELAKIRQVHEYTNWRVPDAELQVAGFKEQVRRFEMRESQAKHRLAKLEIDQAKEKQRIRQVELNSPISPEARIEEKRPKSFWQTLTSKLDVGQSS